MRLHELSPERKCVFGRDGGWYACVSVCVCVCVRETERERQRERKIPNVSVADYRAISARETVRCNYIF